MTPDQVKAQIAKHGLTSGGMTVYLKYLSGKRLTNKQAIMAKCFDCCGYYADGRQDCGIKVCPLYPLMPYGEAVKQARQGRLYAKNTQQKELKSKGRGKIAT